MISVSIMIGQDNDVSLSRWLYYMCKDCQVFTVSEVCYMSELMEFGRRRTFEGVFYS